MSDFGRDRRAPGEAGSVEPALTNASRSPLADPHRPLLMDMLQAALAEGGELSAELRRQAAANQGLPKALAGLVDKIAHHAYRVQDEDIQAIKRAGYSEDQIFELVVAASVGRAVSMAEQALAVLQTAASPKTS